MGSKQPLSFSFSTQLVILLIDAKKIVKETKMKTPNRDKCGLVNGK